MERGVLFVDIVAQAWSILTKSWSLDGVKTAHSARPGPPRNAVVRARDRYDADGLFWPTEGWIFALAGPRYLSPVDTSPRCGAYLRSTSLDPCLCHPGHGQAYLHTLWRQRRRHRKGALGSGQKWRNLTFGARCRFQGRGCVPCRISLQIRARDHRNFSRFQNQRCREAGYAACGSGPIGKAMILKMTTSRFEGKEVI